MAKKHLSEDEIRYVISAETDKAQKEIYALSKATKDLKQQQRERLKSMIELESKGKKRAIPTRNWQRNIRPMASKFPIITNGWASLPVSSMSTSCRWHSSKTVP